MPRWLKFCLALLLLPLCFGASESLFWVLRESGRGPDPESLAHARDTWVPLAAGAGGWLFIYLSLPKPMWIYVFGHELTHALWAWVFESRIKKFKVTSRGGYVVLDRVNFFIVLAPYFFPLYALLVAAIYGAGCLLVHWDHYRPVFLFLLGTAYAFHVTLTWHALQTEQTDITSQGTLFAVVVIWLGNVAVLLLLLPPFLRVSVQDAFGRVLTATWGILSTLARWVGA